MFFGKYNFDLIEKDSNLSYWKEVAKDFAKNYTQTLLLPPPNITGKLHLGHSFENVIQDFIVRSSWIIQKEKIYWIAGVDHAGISTQIQIEKLNLEFDSIEAKKSFALNSWYSRVCQSFFQQWERLGLLMDYSKVIFTLDPVIKKQVREAFIKLYYDQLIYKGKRLVNWDPQIKSVVSDIEVDHLSSISTLYYLKYQIYNSDDEYLSVATSRPETMFADECILINPQDSRYYRYIGKQIIHPITKKIIPIKTDLSVKIDFGSGVLKCTPGHDFKDYSLAQTHGLPITSCCDQQGILNKLAGKWQGQSISNIRNDFVKELIDLGICLRTETYQTNLSYSSKTGALIEPLLSHQWFLRLPELIKRIEHKKPNFWNDITILPSRFWSVINNWKEKVQDWCISRQLWWGHRIPVWYHKNTKEIYVGEFPPCNCSREIISKETVEKNSHQCYSLDWEPEQDVLDTWVSSGLLPLFVLDQESDKFLSRFSFYYPITKLVIGYDILFFWMFRMVLLGAYFTGKVPFKQVFFHGLIRDSKGKKMSKSIGNVIEPEKIIEQYGSDSLRLFFCENNIWGTDLVYDENKIKASWRFCQKIWSIAQLITSKLAFTELRKVNYQDVC